jgi:hypothetical protein
MSNFIMQGMTRDGTFLIENGTISSPITNLPFDWHRRSRPSSGRAGTALKPDIMTAVV